MLSLSEHGLLMVRDGLWPPHHEDVPYPEEPPKQRLEGCGFR